jgi:ornithine--oxo-acid transaminase
MSEAHATTAAQSSHEQSVNTQRVRLLDVLGMNVHYANCLGSELFTSDGAHILDFNSGYCVHNEARNHPDVILLLKDELDRNGPAMLHGHVPELAGELAPTGCVCRAWPIRMHRGDRRRRSVR